MSAAKLHSAKYTDEYFTPPDIARKIVDYFKPSGVILEPCIGKGAFNCIQEYGTLETCEDFMKYETKVDWIITNPPWSQLTMWMQHAFTLTDNVVFLVPLQKVFSSMPRWNALKDYGSIAEVLDLGRCHDVWKGNVNMPLGAIHFKRGKSATVWTNDFLKHEKKRKRNF